MAKRKKAVWPRETKTNNDNGYCCGEGVFPGVRAVLMNNKHSQQMSSTHEMLQVLKLPLPARILTGSSLQL